MEKILKNVDGIFHQAALGSVPRSISDPLSSNEANVTGFLNILDLSVKSGVKTFTYASSSAVYGDHPSLPKIEDQMGKPLSPYAATKHMNELYSSVYSRLYDFYDTKKEYF